jgi:uncharacterized membrane protein
MIRKTRSPRRRDLNPTVDSLEGRALLNAAWMQPMHHGHAEAHVEVRHRLHGPQTSGLTITILGTASAGGYQFLNFNGPNAGTNANTGSNDNGISNSGTAVGFDIDNNGAFHNFTVNPLRPGTFQSLNINGSTTAQAFGVNRRGVVVGSDGNGNAFYLSHGKVNTFIPLGGSAATAFGINDRGTIVGQYTTGGQMPGFIRLNARKAIRLDAPSGPDTVNAQGINNRGLVVGFYLGTDGQVHGFMAKERAARNGQLTGTAIADPTIPNVPGEPGATFVFSQVLAVNDKGIAVGYYGDSTTSQHGFIYNTNTGQYTFLDDPSEAFHNGVEVTQITGITNSGEITGFYSDANGVFHSFVASTGMM